MLMRPTLKIRAYERGLVFTDGDFTRILGPGRHWLLREWLQPVRETRVERVSVRDERFRHPDLEVIVKSGQLGDEATVLDLADHERALVFVDGRFHAVLGPGLHVYWNVFHRVETEVVDARQVRFEHAQLTTILSSQGRTSVLEPVIVEAENVGLLFVDGRHRETLPPGAYAFWKEVAGRLRVRHVDLREQVLDVGGQDVMTADKVTLRLNAVVVYKVADPLRSVTTVDNAGQALYREAQLALRAVVGTRELDALLADKDAVTRELADLTGRRAAEMGLEVVTVGLRDVILPGEMKALMNRVTEARKAAEANLIVRREETAAMRSQANTARILEASPTLMKLRELEVLEKVAEKAQLSVVLGDSTLAERVMKLV